MMSSMSVRTVTTTYTKICTETVATLVHQALSGHAASYLTD